MKNLFGVLSCLIVAVAVAMAQQGGESKSQPPALQPTGEVLVKALLAADKAQSKRETPSMEELKKTIQHLKRDFPQSEWAKRASVYQML